MRWGVRCHCMQSRNPTLADVSFTKDDQELFQIDDLRLKGDAIRYSILPKLNILLNEGALRIKSVYGVEVFEDSGITQSPNFRMSNRKKEIQTDYQWADISLRGKGVKGKWLGLERNDGKPVVYPPFSYGFRLTDTGLSMYLDWQRLEYKNSQMGQTGASDKKGLDFVRKYEPLIRTLCYRTGMSPELYWSEDCDFVSTVEEHYDWMVRNEHLVNCFSSFDVGFPIALPALLDLVERFVWFYPVYDSYVQISMDKQPRFTELLSKLNEWMKTYSETEDRQVRQQNLPPTPDLIKAKQAAEQHIRVMPGIRWQVFQRDNWRCCACGRGAADEVILHVDHVTPRSRGGKDTLENFQTLCHECNIGKSNKDATDLRRRAQG